MIKQILFNDYKTYRNSIVELTKKSKLNYYKNYFSQNSNNLRKVWKGIKGIINVKQKAMMYLHALLTLLEKI